MGTTEMCKCGKLNHPGHLDRHADGTLKKGYAGGRAAAANARAAIGKSPKARGKTAVQLLRMMKTRWNLPPTRMHYRVACAEVNRGVEMNMNEWVDPYELNFATVGELILFMQELYMLRGNEGLFKNFANRVAPVPARDLNLNLNAVPTPEADSPEGKAARDWFERLRPETAKELH